jgi:serine/threonine-protein kinase
MAGKYKFERRLGGGGMAEVFLAHTVGAEGFQRPVAIKRVLPSFSEDAQFSTMFVNEARISAMLRHPNIVQVFDFDRDAEQRLFLVMELVEGKDLDDLARSGALPVPVVVHVIAEVLEGLAHAHDMTTPDGRALGLVHRDISPHNVLVSWDGAVKVSDFGIAKAMLASSAMQSGMIKGKPLYMAPEQVTSPDSIDSRADLFAVGVMFYELLTSKRVYQGTTNEEVLTDVIQVARGWRQLVAPNVARPDLPWDVSQVASMLLAPDRQQRFASARDALDALLRTTSAPTRGTLMLSQLMSERFPTEVPRRRMTPQQRAALPTVRPDQLADLAGSAVAKQRMSAETRTIEPVPATAGTPAPAAETVPGRKRGGEKSRVAMIAALAAAAAVVAGGVTLLIVKSAKGTPKSPPAPVLIDAAPAAVSPPPIDAGPAPAPVDAAPAPAPVDAAPPPDARKGSGSKPPKPPHKQPDAGVTKPTRDPCDTDGDGIPDCR